LGLGPHSAKFISEVRADLLTLTQSLFPAASDLYVLGPEYDFGSPNAPGIANADAGFFFGLDSQ
jgi:hypothetical protein